MKTIIIWMITVIVVYFSAFLAASADEVRWGVVYEKPKTLPIPASEWKPSTKLWLGRSCVGEAGFDAVDECIGIAWVYAARYRGGKASFESVVRRYSAAVKHRSTTRRPWVLELNLEGTKPLQWPSDARWKVHRPMWKLLLAELDQWAIGKRPNPVPEANHFGGAMDKPGQRWVEISPANGLKFRNTFYRSPWR